ncbi:hypothetical protein E4U16_000630, partial [Claviceps sp. LM84 group G4]
MRSNAKQPIVVCGLDLMLEFPNICVQKKAGHVDEGVDVDRDCRCKSPSPGTCCSMMKRRMVK